MKRKDNYPTLPHIIFGLLEEGGFFVTLPFKGISLNQYRRMHHGQIKKEKSLYKSILDVILISSIKKNFIGEFNEEGVKLNSSLFKNEIEIEWILNFKEKNTRDVSNYTQKIVLDAIVKTNIIEDDNSKYVLSDKTVFGTKQIDSITCILMGEIENHKFLKYLPKIKYEYLKKSLED